MCTYRWKCIKNGLLVNLHAYVYTHSHTKHYIHIYIYREREYATHAICIGIYLLHVVQCKIIRSEMGFENYCAYGRCEEVVQVLTYYPQPKKNHIFAFRRITYLCECNKLR